MLHGVSKYVYMYRAPHKSLARSGRKQATATEDFEFHISYDHYHHHISVMELGHLLTRSGLTYPEVSSKVCHDSFCQLENSVSLPWVIYYKAFCLHVVFSFSCTPVICPKLVLYLIPL